MINAAMGNKARFDEFQHFFEGVGNGDSAGIWEDVPKDRPEFREYYQRQLAKQASKAKSEEMI